MRPLALDFLHPHGRGSAIGPVVLALGLAAAAGAAYRYVAVVQETEQLEATVADQRRVARREAPAPREQDPKVLQEVVQANAVIAELALPWDELFADLEAAALPGIALLSLQPAASGQQLRIAGEARRYEDVLEYVERLEAREGLENVFLVGHELRANTPRRAMAFTVVADWTSPP